MIEKKWNPTDSQTLIERFDNKSSTHITAFIAIIFGAFTLLTFLQGKIRLLHEPSIIYLLIIEFGAFPLAILYCLARSLYYARCVEKVKARSELILMETDASDDTLNDKDIPWIVRSIAWQGKKKRMNLRVYFFIPLVYALWIGIILAVLNLPLQMT
jgi:predicted permease